MTQFLIYTKSPAHGGEPVAGPYRSFRQAITSLLHTEQTTGKAHALVTVEGDEE